jgi:hypothetical protein
MPRVVPSQVVALIDRLFPFAAGPDPQPEVTLNIGHLTKLVAIVSLVDQVPEELKVLDADEYTLFVSSVAVIRAVITIWQVRGPAYPLDYLREFGNLSPVTVLRRALARCPDEFPATGTAELIFIPDHDLRESLRIDISATNKALSNGEWKAATVLAGSVVEALLLWALQQQAAADVDRAVKTLQQNRTLTTHPGQDLERWTLHPYIEVAAELNIIEAETAAQARLAKDFRNLIHPGKAARLRQICDRGTALSAVAAMELVVRDLT